MFIKKSEYESLLKQIENLERDLRIANSHADYWKNQYINSRLGVESCDDCLNMIKMFLKYIWYFLRTPSSIYMMIKKKIR